jgi:hypothetical protein
VIFGKRVRLALCAAAAALTLGATTVAVSGTASAADAVAGPVITKSAVTFTIGTPFTATFSPDAYGSTPVKYQYQINDGAAVTVRAVSGVATVTITPTTRTSLLRVSSVGADGSMVAATLQILLANMSPAAAEQDANGDGVADLLVVGDPATTGSGLWLAPGRRNDHGRVRVPAANIGRNGLFYEPPSIYDGTLVVTGDFRGNGLQDVLVYYPSGFRAGGGSIISGSGDGSALTPDYSDNELHLFSGMLSDLNGDNPIQLANGYGASGAGFRYPELIAINGSASNGYHLTYLPLQGDAPINFIGAVQLPNLTPTGGSDWQNWQLATVKLASGPAMFLWQRQTGALYLWERLAFTDNGDYTGSLSFTPYLISSHWLAGAGLLALQATDFTDDGVPDLWAVTRDGTVTAYEISGLSARHAAKIGARAPQQLT